jgi:hypothetical protein
VFKGLKVRRSIIRCPGEEANPLLGVFELAVTLTQESDPTFVSGKGVLKTGGAILQIAEDAIQLGEGLFKANGFRARRGHPYLQSQVVRFSGPVGKTFPD